MKSRIDRANYILDWVKTGLKFRKHTRKLIFVRQTRKDCGEVEIIFFANENERGRVCPVPLKY